ncbi:MAG: FkbM family methyltransferase [Hyphomicrobiaceae bacterium]|nr:FkbM family methyltransferase [Hyphomicrobiaceae bacterium]
MARARHLARIPVEVEYPDILENLANDVLSGEYESGHDGADLTILDIGANVGFFALWATLRWPGSTLHCYEANPGTFPYLERNTRRNARIHCTHAAVFPGPERKMRFFSRFPGDGEAGLEAYLHDTFNEGIAGEVHEVDVVAPADLPKADIVKLDIEGGEGAVLAALDLSATSLVLAEFQNRRNRTEMQARLAAAGFVAVRDEEAPWDPILGYRDYNQGLAGDIFGHMFYERKGQTRLRRA